MGKDNGSPLGLFIILGIIFIAFLIFLFVNLVPIILDIITFISFIVFVIGLIGTIITAYGGDVSGVAIAMLFGGLVVCSLTLWGGNSLDETIAGSKFLMEFRS